MIRSSVRSSSSPSRTTATRATLAAAGLALVATFSPAAHAAIIHGSGPLGGSINGIPLNSTFSGFGNTATGQIHASADNIPPDLGPSLNWSFIHITLFCWFAAQEQPGAVNLAQITGGNFSRDVTTTFDTGQVMHVNQTATNIGGNNLALTFNYNGQVPTVPAGSFFQALNGIDNISQLNPNTIRGTTTRQYIADLDNNGAPEMHSASAVVNIGYGGGMQLPGNEQVSLTNLVFHYDESTQTATWDLNTSVSLVPTPGATALLTCALPLALRRRRREATH
ncbi:MAG TPA: hypothetical protein VG797_03535 [Phycisphaerales bacterium]|nr:hypothetical protein [Phycisphaerales bacterium]